MAWGFSAQALDGSLWNAVAVTGKNVQPCHPHLHGIYWMSQFNSSNSSYSRRVPQEFPTLPPAHLPETPQTGKSEVSFCMPQVFMKPVACVPWLEGDT